MIDILLAAIIFLIGHCVIDLLYRLKNKHEQYTFIYCPRCNVELIKNGLFITDKDGIVQYGCPNCGITSFWDFAHYPAPMLRTCGSCKHLVDNEFGSPYCEKQCNKECHPDTQVAFEYKNRRS